MRRVLLLETQGLELKFSKDRVCRGVRLLRDLILERREFPKLDRYIGGLGISKFWFEGMVVVLNVEYVVVLLVFLRDLGKIFS
jgi:hypothetical protein